MADKSLWTIMVEVPDPEVHGSKLVVPWNGATLIGDAVNSAIAALQSAYPTRVFTARQIGTTG